MPESIMPRSKSSSSGARSSLPVLVVDRRGASLRGDRGHGLRGEADVALADEGVHDAGDDPLPRYISTSSVAWRSACPSCRRAVDRVCAHRARSTRWRVSARAEG